ncbi:helix-turn-helix domain-containing protein [Desulfovibrio sp. SGI.169]|uniref:helix-turn-helix domain-containing protein n=1 Tax=Desulfovibrio sp. SGI.169 TaxID=3420561 RepID=UPI003D00C8EA
MEDYPKLIEAVSLVLKRLREDAGLSKRKLAEISSIDRVYLLQLEQGKYRPTLNSIFFLAEALEMPAAQLVDLIEREQRTLKNASGDG